MARCFLSSLRDTSLANDVSSIYLNSEAILIQHMIDQDCFVVGLLATTDFHASLCGSFKEFSIKNM